MNLDKQSLAYITNVVNTARMVDIDDVIIEPGKVRAIDENKTVVLFQDEDVPEMPFNSIGLNRINVFLSRLGIAKTQENFAVTVQVDDNNQFARGLVMSGKGIKVDYRCANPRTIQAPKNVNDTLVYRIKITPEAVYLLEKGRAAMGADTVSVISNDKGVTFELIDVNSDKFSHTFTKEVETLLDDAETTFVHKYPVATLLALFKDNPEGTFSIGKKGILNIVVNHLNVFVLPQV